MRFKRIILVVTFSAIVVLGFSQPPANQPPDPQTDPDAVPITGLEYLLLGGGVYGVSRFLKNRKNKNNPS